MTRARRVMLGVASLSIAAFVTAGAALWHHAGYRAYIVHTGSMNGTYNSGDLVFDRRAAGPLHVGEVITFLHSGLSSDVVTHRIVGLSGGTIQTKGDANPTADTWNIRYDQVQGVVQTSIPRAGYLVYFFQQRAGDAAAVTGAIALMLLYDLFFGSSAPPADTARPASVPASV